MREGIQRIDRITYNGTGVAPHTATLRGSLTIPTGAYGYLQFIGGSVIRATAPSTGGIVEVYLTLTPSSGSEVEVWRIGFTGTSVGTRGSSFNTPGLMLGAGDVLKVYTADSSTGGTCDYHIFVEVQIRR